MALDEGKKCMIKFIRRLWRCLCTWFSSDKHWPRLLYLIRHGESTANVARLEAIRQDVESLEDINFTTTDADVPLTPLGRAQAEAVGLWLRSLPPDKQPNVIIVSTFKRAQETMDLALGAWGVKEGDIVNGRKLLIISDERVREKDFGVLDGLLPKGIQQRFPEERMRYKRLGKFNCVPIAGESWNMVTDRFRNVFTDICLHYARKNVAIFSHMTLIECSRYVIERMTQEEALLLDKTEPACNCCVVRYRYDRHSEKPIPLELQQPAYFVVPGAVPTVASGDANDM